MLIFTFFVFIIIIPATMFLAWDGNKWALAPAAVWLVWLVMILRLE